MCSSLCFVFRSQIRCDRPSNYILKIFVLSSFVFEKVGLLNQSIAFDFITYANPRRTIAKQEVLALIAPLGKLIAIH